MLKTLSRSSDAPDPVREELRPVASLGRGAQYLADLWSSSGPVGMRALLLFGSILFLLCASRAYIGLSGTRVYSHDAFLVLDGAWRMLNGQRPHVDFNSMIGPAAYLPTVIGFRLSGNTAVGFGYGQALVAFLIGTWAFLLGARLSPVPRMLFALCAACVAGSPAMIGPSPFEISPGMTYNRYTYALLSLLLLECMEPEADSQLTSGLSSGVVLGVLAFLKITGVVVGVALVLALATIYPKSKRRWMGLLAAFAVVTFAFLAYLHFRVDLVLHDLSITAAAKRIAYAERYDLYSIFMEAGMAFAVVLAGASWLGNHERPAEAKRILKAAAIVLVASVLLVFGNFQRSELPLATFFLILVINELVTSMPQHAAPENAALNIGLFTGTVYVAGMLLATGLSLVLGMRAKTHTVPGATHMPTPALASFVPIGLDHSYTYAVNDGFSLLAAHRQPGEHVMSLDFTNPFSFGLWIPPAPGGTTNLQFHGSFDEKHYVPAEQLFGHAELVMVPVQELDLALLDGLKLVYAPYLQRHYALVAESSGWQLYRRHD